jgi:hypothetical protein
VKHCGPAEAPDAEFPLLATTGRVLQHYQSGAQTRQIDELNDLVPEAYVEVHPDTAARHGLTEGDWARVSSRRGATTARVRRISSMPADVVFLPSHFARAGRAARTQGSHGPVRAGDPDRAARRRHRTPRGDHRAARRTGGRGGRHDGHRVPGLDRGGRGLGPRDRLLDAVLDGSIDAMPFTSVPAAASTLAIAKRTGRQAALVDDGAARTRPDRRAGPNGAGAGHPVAAVTGRRPGDRVARSGGHCGRSPVRGGARADGGAARAGGPTRLTVSARASVRCRRRPRGARR